MNTAFHSQPWQAAAALAARLHQHQKRKDGATPYIAHPCRVVLTVTEVFDEHDPVILAAALLHDTIEDTPADYDDLAEAVGTAVADLVAALTKDMRIPECEREQAYEAQLAAAPWQARLIKLADVYDNLWDSVTSKTPVKVEDKVRMALRLAGGDPRLQRAVDAVHDLMQWAASGEPRRNVSA